MSAKVAIVMMIAPDHDLEWQALLLGASVREFVSCPNTLYFCIEPDHLPRLGPQTKALIDKLGGVLRSLPDGQIFTPSYAIGNKMRACTMDYDEEHILFVDSDMLFARPSDLGRFLVGDVAVQQEIGQIWTEEAGAKGAKGEWDYLYRTHAISEQRLDDMRQRAPKYTYPYFNAGAVAFRRDSGFAQDWLEIALKIDADKNVTLKRPWLDQIAFPIAAMKGGYDLKILPTFANKRPTRDTLPELILSHYHGLIMMRFSHLSRVADRCVRTQLGLRSLDHLLDLVLRQSAKAQALQLQGKAPFAKVMGERNLKLFTAERLIQDNFETKTLIPRMETPRFFAEAKAAFGKVEEAKHTPRDLLHQATYDTLFGWAHARPDPALLARQPRFEQTRFICLYAHPARWLRSMYDDLNNPLVEYLPQSFADFLIAPFAVSERDMLPYTFEGTPLEVYQEKLRGYLDLWKTSPEQTLIMSSEALQNDPQAALKVMEPHFKPKGALVKTATKLSRLRIPGLGRKRESSPPQETQPDPFFGFDEQARNAFDAQLDTQLFDALAKARCL